jgi:hypothetical protein
MSNNNDRVLIGILQLRFSDASGTTYSRTSAFSYDNDELLNVIKAKNEEIQLKTQQVRELQEQLAILKEQVDNQASVNQQVITDKSKRKSTFYVCLI